MNIPKSVEPAAWGMTIGAVAAMIIGFSWGGWITNGTAMQMEIDSAKAAIVLAFTPLCVAKAEPQISKLEEFKVVSRWKRNDFVTDAGWVDNVNDKYQADVAEACAVTLIEGHRGKLTFEKTVLRNVAFNERSRVSDYARRKRWLRIYFKVLLLYWRKDLSVPGQLQIQPLDHHSGLRIHRHFVFPNGAQKDPYHHLLE